ncbi:MAG: 5-bromo-4-chloroindolyl phosphate hydrolysis family protein [Clostridiales Family XIII bacterium]|jgi:hypothetical protein|nr:5-bromo-4-chloroindolyl phosphate hydrolysis family protein [Clostridiales Family XIII bacterium]
MVRFVLGIIGMVGFGVAAIICTILFLVIPFAAADRVFLSLLIPFAAAFVVSAFFMNAGAKRRGAIARLGRYSALFDMRRTVLNIEDITAQTGISPKQVRQDMRHALEWRLHFDLYMDHGEKAIMRGRETYRQYLECERLRKEKETEEAARQSRLSDPETATLEAFRVEGYAILDKIRAANVVLPGEEISSKLSKLERTTKRIFDHIEKHPGKIPETRRLMNYHLPTTLKLVERYCQYDIMEYQPENVVKAKAEIENALETVDVAFGNFLESLFHEDTLDITTDAEVLKQMLEQEGLTGKPFEFIADQEKGEKT